MITNSQYLYRILGEKKILPQEKSRILIFTEKLYPHIRKWAKDYLGQYPLRIMPSGSLIKGTGVRGNVDVDLFISFNSKISSPIKEIYSTLYKYFNKLFSARQQNVSVRVRSQGINIDLVPGIRMPNAIYPHTLYVRKRDTWTKTNIHKQILAVKESGCRNEIILTKIWRDLNNLEFPSFYLELSVIEALKKKRFFNIEKSIINVFEYLKEEFPSTRIVDPANSQNIISGDVSHEDKVKIYLAAEKSLNETYWERVICGIYAKKYKRNI